MKLLAFVVILLVVGCSPIGAPSASGPAPSPAAPTSVGPTIPASTNTASPAAAVGEIVEARSGVARNPADAATPEQLATMVAADSAFAFDLYRSVIGAETGNVFLSPYSISTALSMVLAGARGSTADELAAALHVKTNDASWHAARNRLELELAALANYQMAGNPDAVPITLEPTNAFFGRAGYPFHQDYLDILAANYGAGVHAMDFMSQPDAARDAINAWVSERTRERIPALLPDGFVTGATVAVLVNAIYFKGNWIQQFEESETDDEPFHLLDGSTIDVPMMQSHEKWQYSEGDGWQAIELPYVGGASMLLIVPEEGRYTEIEGSIDSEFVTDTRSALAEYLVDLEVPRWESESNVDLIPHLESLGVRRLFGDADLTGIADAALSVNGVVHSANVTVDEKGTEAAAATAVGVLDSGAPPAELKVDRPFMYLIYDDDNGEILFMGRLLEP
jgi:serpin B